MKLISPVFLDKDDVLEIDLSGLVDDIEKVCAKVIRYIGVEEFINIITNIRKNQTFVFFF